MQFPIIIGLHRSRIQVLLFFCVTAIAALGINQLPRSTGNLPVFWLLWSLITLLAGIQLWRQKLPMLRLERGGEISLQTDADAPWKTAALQRDALVHPMLTVFRLQACKDRFTLVVTVDSLMPEDFRRLRVFLRWQASLNVTGDDA